MHYPILHSLPLNFNLDQYISVISPELHTQDLESMDSHQFNYSKRGLVIDSKCESSVSKSKESYLESFDQEP